MTFRELLEYNFIDIGGHSLNTVTLIKFALVIVIGRLIYWLFSKQILRRFFQKIEDPGREFAIRQFVKYIIYLLTFLFALQTLGISLSVLWAGSAALLVGFGLGMQQNFNDLVSGIILLIESSVAVGDVVTVDGIVGRVKRIGLRTSEVESMDNITIVIPNSKLVVDNVINWSYNGRYTRFHIDIGVGYDSDPEEVKKVLLRVADTQMEILSQPKTSVQFSSFGDSSLDFKLHFYTYNFWEIERIKSDIRFKIFAALKKENIEIPFPQTDLWLRNAETLRPQNGEVKSEKETSNKEEA